jgi:hypothetical protein
MNKITEKIGIAGLFAEISTRDIFGIKYNRIHIKCFNHW